MPTLFKILFICLLTINTSCVFAADLQQAKTEGLVGEQLNGYLGIVSSKASSDVRELVKDINAKRKAEYQSIADKNNTSLDTVELLAGKKAIKKTRPGDYVQTATGWKRK